MSVIVPRFVRAVSVERYVIDGPGVRPKGPPAGRSRNLRVLAHGPSWRVVSQVTDVELAPLLFYAPDIEPR